MMLKLTAAQKHVLLQHLQAGRRKPVAPFPLSLIERTLCALLDGVEVLARRFVGILANLLRLPKPS